MVPLFGIWHTKKGGGAIASLKLPSFYARALAQRFQMAEHAKNKYTSWNLTKFSKTVSGFSIDFRFRSLQALHILNLSSCCRHKCYQSISRNFESSFWQVFAIWNHCASASPLHYARSRFHEFSPLACVRPNSTFLLGRYVLFLSPPLLTAVHSPY